MFKKLIWTTVAVVGSLQAGVILNAPSDYIGFFNGYNFDQFGSNTAIAPLSWSQLPTANGVAGIKLYGSASINDPYSQNLLVAAAQGTATGTLDVDTAFLLNYHFTSPSLPDGNWDVQAWLDTSEGWYFVEQVYSNSVNGQGVQGSDMLAHTGNMKVVVPAGTEIYKWAIILTLGQYNYHGSDGTTLSLSIPMDSLDLVAQGLPSEQPSDPPAPSDPGAAVPEPATWITALTPLAAFAGRAVRRRYKATR